MRGAAFRFMGGNLLICQLKRGAVINRRHAACQLPLALALQLIGGLVTGINQPARLQIIKRRFIFTETVRLLERLVIIQTEPSQIGLYGLSKFFC